MPGLRGQQVESRNKDSIARRNSQKLARKLDFISPSEVITVDASGKLVLSLITNGGLVNTAGSLGVLADDPVVLSSDGVGLSAKFKREHDHAYSQPAVPVIQAALTQVASEQAAEEAIVASATLSWMGF